MVITQQKPYCHAVTHEYNTRKCEQTYLLLSDLHIDNPKCDRELLKKHLEQAKNIGAPVFIFGDLFCAMQGKYDKRGNKQALRPEHQVVNYFDALVDTTADFFRPYKELIAFISPGNHETAILKNHETDLTARLAAALGCAVGTYQGWIRFQFRRGSNNTRYAFLLSYHHGYGGGGPVTRDVIQTARKAVYLPDADIVVSGHTHDRWIVPVPRVRLKNNGTQVVDEQLHIKLGTYKDEYTQGYGWAVEKGFPPKSLGGVWMTLTVHEGVEGNPCSVSAALA